MDAPSAPLTRMSQCARPAPSVAPLHNCAPSVKSTERPTIAGPDELVSSLSTAESVALAPLRITVGPVYVSPVSSFGTVTVNVPVTGGLFPSEALNVTRYAPGVGARRARSN